MSKPSVLPGEVRGERRKSLQNRCVRAIVRRRRAVLGLVFGSWVAACGVVACGAGAPAPAAPSKAPPASSVQSTLGGNAAPAPLAIAPGYVGEKAPVVLSQPFAATVSAHGRLGEFHAIELDLGAGLRDELEKRRSQDNSAAILARPFAFVAAPDALAAFALLSDSDPTLEQQKSSVGPPAPRDVIWVLVPEAKVSGLNVELLVAPEIWSAFRAKVTVPALSGAAQDIRREYGRALARHLQSRELYDYGAFGVFAQQRLGEIFGAGMPRWGAVDPLATSHSLGELMELGSGYASVELALRAREAPKASRGNPKIPLKALTAPGVQRHEWGLMLNQLGRAVPALPIAAAVPAGFYFVHAKTFDVLLSALDEIERWGSSAAHFLDNESFNYAIAKRYETQLGLRRGPLTELLGSRAVAELAIIGSDPFLRSGSDVTVLFRPKNSALLTAGLNASLVDLGKEHAGLSSSEVQIAGHSVQLTTSTDSAVRRYQVAAGDYVVVSNSPGALAEVLATLDGKGRALAQEKDFQYMLARDASEAADALVYLGEAFIERTVSPRSRVLDARRARAWLELRSIGYAGLLHGYFGGAPRPTKEQLLKDRWLKPSELSHFDGKPITFSAAQTPVSAWGTPLYLTPLIDLETPLSVSAEEQGAYQSFARSYESAWSDAVDPIALRLRWSPDHRQLHAQLRVLPVVRESSYGYLQRFVGNTQLDSGAKALGGRLLLAFARDSSLLHEFEGTSRGFLGRELKLDWLGDYAFVGVADEPELAEALRGELAPKPPETLLTPSGHDELGRLPLYAGVSIKSRLKASLFLELGRKFVLDFGQVENRPSYRGTPVSRVVLRGEHGAVYFALGRTTLFLSLNEKLLQRLLDREANGEEPSLVTAGRNQRGQPVPAPAQVGFELHTQPQGALYTVLAWAEQRQRFTDDKAFGFAQSALAAWRHKAATPEARALFLDYFGAEPVTRDGLGFVSGDEGLTDPAHGNAFHPKWPALPVLESDFGKLLAALAGVRSGISFDTEAPGSAVEQRSLRVVLDVNLR